jgi:glutamyl/glutaminyl-tRNA synthetase
MSSIRIRLFSNRFMITWNGVDYNDKRFEVFVSENCNFTNHSIFKTDHISLAHDNIVIQQNMLRQEA